MSNTAGGWFTNSNLDHYDPVTIPHLVVTRCSYKATTTTTTTTTTYAVTKEYKNTLKIIFCFFCEVLHSWLSQGIIRARGHELHSSTVWRWFIWLICRILYRFDEVKSLTWRTCWHNEHVFMKIMLPWMSY